MAALDRADVFDGHAIDRIDLADHERDECLVGKHDDEFIDHVPRSGLEHLDSEYVSAHRADAARDLTEGARAIGEPDADHDGVHGGRLGPPRFVRMTELCGSAELDETAFQVPHGLRDALLVLDEGESNEALTPWPETDAR